MEIKKEMKDLVLHGEDLEVFGVTAGGDGCMKDEEEIWFETASQHHEENNDNNNLNNDDFLDVDVSDPSSLFYADFPPLPDFPCMSSSSSSSSTPAATVVKPFGTASSTSTSSSASTASSGAASWAVLKSDADHDPEPSSSTAVSVDVLNNSHLHPGSDHRLQRVEEMVMDDVDECMDMMQNFGCIDLLENTDICWDPSPLFEDNGDEHEHDSSQYQFLQPEEMLENHLVEEERVFKQFMQQHQDQGENTTSNNTTSGVVDHDVVIIGQNSGGGGVGGDGIIHEPGSSPDDLAMVFFEWLKSNKEAISAQDLRNIKIKKSTIENAAKRLGGGQEGMKQLLKLILEWVQNHHLQNKRMMIGSEDEIQVVSGGNNNTTNNNLNPNCYSIQEHNTTINENNNATTPSDTNANPNCPPEPQCFSPATWLPTPPHPPPPFVNESLPPPPPGFPPTVGFMGYPPPIPPSDYHSWGPTPMQYGMGPHYGAFPDAAQFGGYGNPPPYPGFYYHPGPPTEGLVRLGSSATKEARKKRMARQRRFFSHHHRSSHHNSHHQHQNHGNHGSLVNHQHMMNQMAEQQHAMVGNGNCGVVAPQGNWVYWPPPQPQVVPPPQVNHPGPMVAQMMPPMERPGNSFHKQVGIDKKQGWKTEKNLRFLLQKVLKQSDVGNLGRIVLPKKEAETHLPELEARDGIPIAMEDIGTSRVWNMRYRFWPNNKSRMYLLENTGDFVRSNGLQEGDFIVIYSDVKCGKYMIRGVKVRPQQQNTKPELSNKKSSKSQKTEGTSSPAGNGLSSSPNIMQMQS
ncbi:B3 domain-containing transcription factor ABI3 isoform X2 [Spinacia oleracea]|uniref:B3 domain-containing transcription factor ABI3 isoform X2 n=1 Tax=Spinacia oleracea TaxID=3562 RepID=A0ABM3QVX8_SPIOL|nr:B3 domain-containing transcription factor ABI3 isoform X2 [Spinacia oleracea]